MREQSHEISTRFEQGDQFPIRLRGGIGNSTLTTILTDLQTDHTLGNEKSIGAISRFLGCFEPIADSSNKQPESLWDQTATAVMAYRHLPQEDQEQINGMMDTLLWSLANQAQERKVGGHTRDVSPHVRDLATTIGLTTDSWDHVTEPTHHAKQNKLPPKLAIAGALTAASLIASCTPARPTITPEITRPAITQPTQTTETPTLTPTETPNPTETQVGPAIPQEMADQYPQGITIEFVGTDTLPLAKDASTGNLIGWYSEKDSAWHFAEDGMQMKYIENFDNLGPAITTEVVKTNDITNQTLADWKAGIHLPGEVILTGVSDTTLTKDCPAQFVNLLNLVLTNIVDERVTLNPGLANQISIDRAWFTFAYRKNSVSHTLTIEPRYWFGNAGSLWPIDSQNILSKFDLGKKFSTSLTFIPPESECTNSRLLSSPTSLGPSNWQFVVGRLGDDKLSFQNLEETLSDENEVVFLHDQIWVGDISPYKP